MAGEIDAARGRDLPIAATGRDAIEILSARNPRLAMLRRLSGRRSARTDAGRFVIDGPRLVAEALAAGVAIDEVYVPVGAFETAPVVALRGALDAASVRVYALADDTFASVAGPESPQPAIAVATPPASDLATVLAADAVLVLVDVADPGNAGTLVRLAEAAGIGGVVAAGSGVEWWNPKVVRASAGSLFRVPVATAADPTAVLATLAEHGTATYATVLDASVPYTAVDYRGPSAFVLGNEAHGLSAALVAQCTVRVHIPMAGAVESLNVAMAGAVCAFELARQRRG